MHLLDPPLVVLATAALLLLPGWLVLVAAGWRDAIDPMLRPVAALTVSLALLAPSLVLVLWIGAPITWCVGWLATCSLGAGAMSWRRRAPLQVSWTTVGAATVALALLGGALAAWTGGDLRRDQTYHTGRVVKLAELDAPTFASASRIEDGGATTPYAFPLWHGAQAVVVRVTGVEPLVLAWMLPALLVPIAILAFAGLARAWLGSPGAGLAAALAWLLMRVVDYAPDYRFLTNAQWPGMVAALLVIPLVCALMVPALFGTDRRTRRASLTLGALGVLVVLGLHANYVLFPALLVAGALLWLVLADRDLGWRRVLALCAAWGGAAAAGIIALLPVLRDHAGPAAAGSGVDAMVRASRNASYFEQVGGGWVLKLEPLVGQSLTMLAFAIAAVLVLVAPRRRASALVAAGLLAVVVAARVPLVTESILGLGNLTAVTRLWLAVLVPTTLALAAALVWARRSPLRMVALVAVIALALATRTTQDRYEFVTWLLAGAVVAAIGLVVVARRLGSVPPVEHHEHVAPVSELGARTIVAAAALVLAGSVASGVVLEPRFRHAVHRDGVLGAAWDDRARLRDIPAGSVVISDEFTSYAIPAIAPLYVVGDYKWWLERSEATDTVERLEDVRAYVARDATDRERAEIRERRRIDLEYLVPTGPGS